MDSFATATHLEGPPVLSREIFRPLRLTSVAPAIIAAAAWLAPSTARAAVALAADLEMDAPTQLDIDAAPAFALRLGWQVHLPLIVFTPEVGYHHVEFADDVTLNRGIVGVRIAVGEIFRVGAFGHVGVGNAAYHFGNRDEEVTDATYDVGGFLDFTLLPLLDIGIHAGYGKVKAGEGGDPLQWVPIGAHVALIF